MPDFVCRPGAEAMFAALGRRGLHQDRADITYVQISAPAEPDAAAPAVPLRSRRIRICGSGAGSVPPNFVLGPAAALSHQPPIIASYAYWLGTPRMKRRSVNKASPENKALASKITSRVSALMASNYQPATPTTSEDTGQPKIIDVCNTLISA